MMSCDLAAVFVSKLPSHVTKETVEELFSQVTEAMHCLRVNVCVLLCVVWHCQVGVACNEEC